jgi:hypothetical protein
VTPWLIVMIASLPTPNATKALERNSALPFSAP